MEPKLKLNIRINIENNISLWQAIKLRIAGKNYKRITNEMIRQIKLKLEKSNGN